MAETQEKPVLTEAEKKQLERLLAKANAANVHAPAMRIGDPYIALTNLSVPRRGDKDRQVDLVMAGDTVYLTPEEAAQYMRHGDKDGRRVAVIRPKNEVGAEGPPRVHPQLVSGPIFRPVQPPPGSDLPRPDPPGSSNLATMNAPVPEMTQPVPGTENMPPAQDAMDILPGGQLARQQVRDGADMDLVGAVKAQSGLGKERR